MTNQTANFQPTPLQKFLGRHYKWWYVIQFYFKAQTHYRGNSTLFALADFIGFGGSLLVWYITTINSSNFNTSEILTYLWVGSVYTGFTPMWYSENLASQIHGGAITSKLIRPSSLFWEGVCEFIGRGTLASSLLLNITAFLALPFVFQFIIPPVSLAHFILFLLIIPIAFFSKFCIEFIFGSITFWLTHYVGLLAFKDTLIFFFQGGKLPLTVLVAYAPWIIYQPIALQLHHPMQIYLGKYSPQETVLVFLGGIAWCLVLYAVAKITFKAGLKRNESVGL